MAHIRTTVRCAALSTLISCLPMTVLAEENKIPSLMILPADVQVATQLLSAEAGISHEYTGSITKTKAFSIRDLSATAAPVPELRPQAGSVPEKKQVGGKQLPVNSTVSASTKRKKTPSKLGQKVMRIAASENSRRITGPMPIIIGAFR